MSQFRRVRESPGVTGVNVLPLRLETQRVDFTVPGQCPLRPKGVESSNRKIPLCRNGKFLGPENPFSLPHLCNLLAYGVRPPRPPPFVYFFRGTCFIMFYTRPFTVVDDLL